MNINRKITRFEAEQTQDQLNFIPVNQGYSSQIKHDVVDLLQPLTVLQMVTEPAEPIQELSKLHNLGGSVTNGLHSTVGAVLENWFEAAGTLFKTAFSTVEFN